MTLYYTVHENADREQKNAPMLPPAGGEAALALDTPSETIVGPCEVRLVPTVDVLVDVRALADVADLDPATSALVLYAESPAFFTLPGGSWVLEATALA